MVRIKGINVHVVSQIDARRLPEYRIDTARELPGSIIECCIPAHPGAQIWFEYSVDGPHPPHAMYLFKLFASGHNITNWDCTSKHDYHGKVAYSLSTARSGHYGGQLALQSSFMFSSSRNKFPPSTDDECIEMRVYRVQERRRIRQLPIDETLPKSLYEGGHILRLSHGCPVEVWRPLRRYRYLLLDPQDEPYATCRFYCHTVDLIDHNSIVRDERSFSPISTATSMSNYFDAETSPQRCEIETNKEVAKITNLKGSNSINSNSPSPLSKPNIELRNKPHSQDIIMDRSSHESCIQTQCNPFNLHIKNSIEDFTSYPPHPSQAIPICTASRPSKRHRSRLNYEEHRTSKQSAVRPLPGYKSRPVFLNNPNFEITSQQQCPTKAPSSNLSEVHPNASSSVSSPQYLVPPESILCRFRRSSESNLHSLRQSKSLDSRSNPNVALPGCSRKSSKSSISSIATSRPLSPFTSGGFLRHLKLGIDAKRKASPSIGDAELSGPTTKAWRGQNVHDEVDEAMKQLIFQSCPNTEDQDRRQQEHVASGRTKLVHRGHHSLTSLLSRRATRSTSA